MAAIATFHNDSSDETLQSQFLAMLPSIEKHARIFFRDVCCQDRRADQIAETVALAWKWLMRLNERGKDISGFKMVFVYLVARAVRCGRRATGMEKASDAMNPIAQRRYGFAVESLSPSSRTNFEGRMCFEGRPPVDDFQDRLLENTVTPVIDQVQFRLDFPAWLATLTPRERKIIRAMVRNERTKDLSVKFSVSPGRISQLRRDFRSGWLRFCGDDADGGIGTIETNRRFDERCNRRIDGSSGQVANDTRLFVRGKKTPKEIISSGGSKAGYKPGFAGVA